MKRHTGLFISTLLLMLIAVTPGITQQRVVDSLYEDLRKNLTADTARVHKLTALGMQYQHLDIDSMILLGYQVIKLSKALQYVSGQGDGNKLLGIAYYMKQNRQRALYHDSVAISYYNRAGNQKGEAAVLNNIGVYYYAAGDYAASIDYYKRSLAIRKEVGDKRGIADCYANIGNNLQASSRSREALPYLIMAMKQYEEINYLVGVASCYNNIGNLYSSTRDYNKAREYILKSIDISNRIGNIFEVSHRYSNLATNYMILDKPDSAEFYFRKAFDAAERTGNYDAMLLASSDLGEIEIHKKNYPEALRYFLRALGYTAPDTDRKFVLYAHFGIGNVYIALGDYQKAQHHSYTAFTIAKRLRIYYELMMICEQLTTIYEKKGDYQEALKYFKLSAVYSDSSYKQKSDNELKDIQHTFSLQQKEKDITLLEKDKVLQERMNSRQFIGIISLILVILLMSISLYLLQRSRKKEEQNRQLITKQKLEIEERAVQQSKLNLLKDRIFTVLAQDLRSPVASVISLIDLLETGLISQDEFIAFKNEMSYQMNQLNLLLDNLLHWAKTQMRGVAILPKEDLNVNHIINQQIELFKPLARQKQITLSQHLSPQASILFNSEQFDLILRNILSNAIKFSVKNGAVTITDSVEETKYTLIITDIGTGMDQETLSTLFTLDAISNRGTEGEVGTGLGLKLCLDFMRTNGGDLQITSEKGKGTSVSLIFAV